MEGGEYMKFQQVFNLDFSNNMTFEPINIGKGSKGEDKADFLDYMKIIYKDNYKDSPNKGYDNKLKLTSKSPYSKNNENSMSLKQDIVNGKEQFKIIKKRGSLKDEKLADEEEKLLEVLKKMLGEDIADLLIVGQNQQILAGNLIDTIEDLDDFPYGEVIASIEKLLDDASTIHGVDSIKKIFIDIESASERVDVLEKQGEFLQHILADIKAKVLEEYLPENLNENLKLDLSDKEKPNEIIIPKLDDEDKSIDLYNKHDFKGVVKKDSNNDDLETKDTFISEEGKSKKAVKTVHEDPDILKPQNKQDFLDKVEGNNDSIMYLDKKLSFDGIKDIIEAQRITKEEILDQITDKMKFVTKKDFSELEVQLKPESLGKLTLKLVLEKGEMTARFIVENNRVKEVVESSFSELKDVLNEKGINIQNLNVTVGQDKQKFNDGARFGNRKKHSKSFNRKDIYEIAIEDNAYISGELNPYYTKEGAFDTKA